MKKRVLFILVIIIIAVALVWFLVINKKTDPNTIILSGNIEATDAQLGFVPLPGRPQQGSIPVFRV